MENWRSGVLIGDLAMSYLRLGNTQEAFRWFQHEADLQYVIVLTVAQTPQLDPVRNKPQYIAMQDRLNLPH
jgi:hypothetical protein